MSVQHRINGYWSDRAPSYDAYQQRPERRDLDVEAWGRVWSGALPDAPADVLDVGTGSGHVARVLAGLVHRVIGIDLAPAMLEIARGHAGDAPNAPDFRTGDAVAPDFPAASFDAITGRYLMWTLREPATAVAHWLRLLRPGGVVAMVDSTWFPEGIDAAGGDDFVPHYDAEVRAALPLAEATSIEATADLLRDGGLVDVRVTPLEEILELDRAHGVAPDHEVQLQFLVTGRRPD